MFQIGINNIFDGVVRYKGMKSWVIFAKNTILLYCPFHFIENFTFLSSISFPIWLTITSKSSKREDAKGFPISNFPFALYFILEIFASPFYTFFSRIIWKDLRELLLVFVIFALKQKTSKTKKTTQQKQKWYNLTRESLLSNNTSNRFKIIMTPTRGKNL